MRIPQKTFHRLLVILIACIIAAASNGLAAITISLKGVTLKMAMREIEKVSDLHFIYKSDLPGLETRVSLQVKNVSDSEALDRLFADTGLVYTIKGGNNVVVLQAGTGKETDKKTVTPAVERFTLTGTVRDSSDGEPLPGALVRLKNDHAVATTADIDGNFSLSVDSCAPHTVLEVSYIGYSRQDVLIGDKSHLDINMSGSQTVLDEIVVTGYGSQRKVNLSGAVSMVNVDETLASRAVTSTSSALNGLIPGLMVQQSSGMAGKDGATLRVRGFGTVNNSSPLLVVDGIPDIDLDRIDMNDIENISVLKDASSAAVYGSRAANGVILITTKKGKSGRVSVNYSGNFSIGCSTGFYDYLDDYPRALTLHNQAARNGNSAVAYKDGTIDQWLTMGMVDPVMYPNTNWWDVIFRNPFTQDHSLSATGGSDTGTYYLSVGILDQEGLMINNNFTRYSFRANVDQKIGRYFKAGLNAAGQWSDQTYPMDEGLLTYNTTYTWDMVRTVAGILPQHPATGEYGGVMAYGEDILSSNLLANYSVNHNKLERKDFNGMGFLEWQPLSFLQFRADYGLTYRNDFVKSWKMPTTLQNFQTGRPGYELVARNTGVTDTTTERTKTILNFHAIFDKEILAGHRLRFQFIYAEEYWHLRSQRSERGDRAHPNITEIDGAGLTTQKAGGSSSEEGLQSIVTKLNYDINDRYMLQALVRWDASSKFSKGYRWGTFPSVSAAWRFSEEHFFESLKPIVNNAKLRFSWGKVGNNSGVDRYYQKDTYKSYPYTFGNNVVADGYAPYKLIDPEFTWESTAMTNLGLELAFFNNRLKFEADIYNKLTTDMIRPGQLSSLLSGLDAPDRNIGEMRNRGAEFNISWQDRVGDVSYSIGLNYSYIRNKLLKWNERLGRGSTFLDYPYQMVYTYKAAGIAQTWEDIVNAPYHSDYIAPGDILIEDVNGDGVISSSDKIAMPGYMRYIPTSDFSLNLHAGWKGFDLGVLLQGCAGRKDFWIDNFNKVNVFASRYSFQRHHLDSWAIDNRDARLPRLTTGNNGGYNQEQSTFWLYSCDYVRLKNLQLGYKVPEKLLEHIGISSVRLHLSAENLFTLTKWPGLDPEKLPKDGSEIPYPLVRNFSIGINISL